MTKITLTADELARWQVRSRLVGVYDEAGNLVAVCTPFLGGQFPDVGGPDPFSDEDTAKVLANKSPGRTTAEILRDLQSR